MSFPYKTISTNIDVINSGSYFSEAELSPIFSSSIQETSFGVSEQDTIEFSVYDIEGNLKLWNYVNSNGVYNIIDKTYKDVNQKTIKYVYKEYNSNYKIAYNGNILLNPIEDLRNNSIVSGNHIISYNFLRNVGGNSKYPLLIKSVSASRRELKLVPAFKSDATNEEVALVLLELSAFSQKKIFIRDIIKDTLYKLKNFHIYNISNSLIKDNRKAFDLIKRTFGLSLDSDVISFLNDTYFGYSKDIVDTDGTILSDKFDGIVGYINNWLYTFYKTVMSYEEIRLEFVKITKGAVEFRLNKLNSFFSYNLADKATILNFIFDVFFNYIKESIEVICNTYTNKFSGYLQNVINFGNNRFLHILNHADTLNADGSVELIVKLQDYLPHDIGLRDNCWISNISISPVITKVVLDVETSRKRFKIAPPNFSIKTNGIRKDVTYQSSDDLRLNHTESRDVSFYKKISSLNVDYSDFSKFVVYSSAELRTKLFFNKAIRINLLTARLDDCLSGSISSSNAISSSYSNEEVNIKSQLDTIYNSFDGYDVYLYNIPYMKAGVLNSDVVSYINSAVEYDSTNADSLINNTPEHIVSDEDNSEYLIFLSMMGHHFDNLYLFIDKFPTTQNSSEFISSYDSASMSNGQKSYTSDFSNVLLEQLGWKNAGINSNKSILETYLSGSNSVSHNERSRLIWNRLLKNLPIIYKTKGTEECIRLVANVYGIPNSLLNIREFGGNSFSEENASSFISEKRFYFTKFINNTEYIDVPVEDGVLSVEFKFKFNENNEYLPDDSIYLIQSNSDKWNVQAVRRRKNDTGDLVLNISSSKQLILEDIPIFNGKIYSVIVKTIDTGELFDYGDGYPKYLYFRLVSTEDDRVIFDKTKEELVSANIARSFESCSVLHFGNYTSDNDFYGNIDKINVWTSEISDSAFLDHSYNFDSYNNYNVDTTYSDLLFRYSIEYPSDFYSASNVTYIGNANKLYNTSASLYNFSPNTVTTVNCLPVSASIFPYHTDKIDIRQSIKHDFVGPNKYKNSKILKKTETVLSRLMPGSKSSISDELPVDSNLIGVYISPHKIRDDDMSNFIGNYDLMDAIGDPSEIYEDTYSKLLEIRNNYNINNLSEVVLYQEFMTLYKNYFDIEFFETINSLLPIRSTTICGVIIEPSILERNKYKSKKIDSAIQVDIDAYSYDFQNRITSSVVDVLTDDITVDLSKNGNENITSAENFNFNYISDFENETRNSIFSINGNAVLRDKTGSLETYTVEKMTNIEFLSKDDSALTGSFNIYNMYKSGSIQSYVPSIDVLSYPITHYSLKNNPFSQASVNFMDLRGISYRSYVKSQQTIDTTINNIGISDGSSPVEVINTNREINQVSLTIE